MSLISCSPPLFSQNGLRNSICRHLYQSHSRYRLRIAKHGCFRVSRPNGLLIQAAYQIRTTVFCVISRMRSQFVGIRRTPANTLTGMIAAMSAQLAEIPQFTIGTTTSLHPRRPTFTLAFKVRTTDSSRSKASSCSSMQGKLRISIAFPRKVPHDAYQSH